MPCHHDRGRRIYSPRMIPRRAIVDQPTYTHVFFRCHDRQFFLRPTEIKDELIRLWARFAPRYSVKIIEFIIMDNHCHLLLYVPDAECLANFMRTVNSRLARVINQHFDRDSQAIKERYKSPVITNETYLIRTMQYVWLNRFKVDGSRPERDRYCSAAWRLNPELCREFVNKKCGMNLLGTLLASYRSLPRVPGKPFSTWIRSLIESAIAKASSYLAEHFENHHTIGDAFAVKMRAEIVNAFRRTCLATADPPLGTLAPGFFG